MTTRLTEQEFAQLRARRGLAPDAIVRAGIDRVSEEISKERQAKLIRQALPKMNKTEASYANEVLYWAKIRGEILRYEFSAVRLWLPGGMHYTPDFWIVGADGRFRFVDAKGEKRNGKVIVREDAAVKIKDAAAHYPEFDFVLVWKGETGEWQEQPVYP